MPNLQNELLRWAAGQTAVTGAVILALGAAYAFLGFRLFRWLLGLSCAGLGWLIGTFAATSTGLSVGWLAAAGAVALVILSVKWERPAVAVTTGACWSALAFYLAVQLSLPLRASYVAGGIGALLGALFACLCYRTITVSLTALQGVILLIIGFVGLSTHVVPAVGVTFRQWANAQDLLVPVFIVMGFAAAYSYQAMHQQGDIRTGH